MIQYPVRVGQYADAVFAFIRDSSDRVIAGGLKREDAEEIVNALNAQPKHKLEDDEAKNFGMTY